MQDGGIQAVARAASVLRALGSAPEGLSLGELAGAVALPKSTVHRLVGALAAEDLVTPPRRGKVRLGPGLARLGAASGEALRERVRPVLLELRRELDETVDLAVLDGASARFVEQLPAPHRLRAVSSVGAAFPLHCTANGKALLAGLPEDEVARLLPARLARHTPATIVTRRALLAELTRVRAEGVAFDREEHTEGVCAVGAAIAGPDGPVAAISVPVPTPRFHAVERRVAERVRAAAAEASHEIAGSVVEHP
jgi:DNA-binding IclR family transcriptional regulator